MKKIISIIFFAITLLALVSCSILDNNELSEVVSQEPISILEENDPPHGEEELLSSSAILKKDYPLIDLSFDKDDSWIVANVRVSAGAEFECIYEIATDSDILERNKEFLSINTFLIGRGTTPNGMIVVYRNGEWYKSVQYIGYASIYSDEFQRAFKRILAGELQELVSQLPGF